MNAFMRNPSSERWSGPPGTGCVQVSDESPPRDVKLVRDAAFYALVTGDTAVRDAARNELLNQARVAGVNFANTSRWCPGVVYDRSPSFGVAAWMTKLHLAYDYLGDEAFSDSENKLLRSWFWHAAKWLQVDADRKLDENFVNRYSGDYRLSAARSSSPGWARIGYLGSQQTGTIARYYNNRRATSMFFVGLVGVHQNDASLQASSKRFVKEWLMFSVYPGGWTGEFERWRSDLPDLGWAYSTYNVAFATMTADLFARRGDTELYTFTTSSGVHGTEGSAKNLRTVMRDHGRYLDGGIVRHGTDVSTNATSAYRIDGRDEGRGWYSVHDIAGTVGNLYYKDTYLRSIYMRTAPGMAGYPSGPASQGGASAWSGVWGIYPGVLFQYGQMEGSSPY